MSDLVSYILLALMPLAFGIPVDDGLTMEKRDNFVWGSLGDSWASGVSFSTTQHTDYDNNKNNCLRWKDSYGPMMEADTSWTTNPQQFHFAACSGALLVNIVKDPQGDNPRQMDLVGNPQLLTYHAGGNNCHFGSVVKDCVYQPTGNFGPAYPDPAGQCFKTLNDSNSYINKEGASGLYDDELKTVQDILLHPAVKNNKDFKLYILGYAHFFNLGDNYCNDMSFGPALNKPLLSNKLRTDMNDGVERVNQILARVASDVKDSRVKFIDVSPAFNTHRFCEDKHSKQDQWYSTDVWLWNLNTPADDPPADTSGIDAWINNTQNPNGLPVLVPATVGVEAQSDPSNGGDYPPWTMRPFHPKKGGTSAIKDYVINNAKADKIPGVVGSDPPPTGQCDCNEDGCTKSSPACCANGTC